MIKENIKLLTILVVLTAIVSYTGCSSTHPPRKQTPQVQYSTAIFENNTGTTISYLYISAKTDDTWGDDCLGDTVIMNGDSYIARLLMGDYDIKAVDENDDVYTFWITVDRDKRFSIDPDDKDLPVNEPESDTVS